jgi:hypothetical protein
VNPSAIGISNDEYDKMMNAKDEDGAVDLADVYDAPETPASPEQKTVVKLMEEKGFDDQKAYRKEYQLKAAHQIMINGGNTGKIAEILKISLGEARSLKRELQARLVKEVKSLDKNHVAGQALMFYDAIQAKALQMANTGNPTDQLRSKIEALKVALQAQTDKQKFLQMSGFWNEPLNTGDASDTHTDGANDIRDMISGVMSGNEYEIVDENEEEQIEVDLLG